MSLYRKPAAALTLAFGLLGGVAHAQPATSPSESPPEGAAASTASVPVVEPDAAASGPDVYLLPDDSGKLRRVLGYRYEDFLEAWQATGAGSGEAAPPAFALSKVSVDGDISADSDPSASVTVRVTVALHSSGWVEAPLELGSLIVESVQIEGGGEQDFIRFDPDQAGYSAWLKGQPGENRTVVLSGRLVLQRQGDVRRLAFNLPAAAASELTLRASSAPVVESPEGLLISSVPAEAGRTTVRVQGIKGRVALRWGEPAAEALDDGDAASLQATVDTIVNVEAGRLSYEAFLSLSGAEPIERVRLRLPPGAAASRPPDAVDYEIVPIAKAAGAEEQPVVELKLAQPATAAAPLRLIVEQDTGAPRGAGLRAAPIEVLGAFRQRGFAAMCVSDQLHAHFASQGRVERIALAELPEGMKAGSPMAAFSTAGSNWYIDVQTQPRQRQIRVTPTYDLHLSGQEALLDVALDYQISGGRTFELQVDLEGWELTEQPIEAGGAVDLAEQHVSPDGILILPLKEAGAEQLRVRFTLRRKAGPGGQNLPLPTASGATALPGALNVSSDEGWLASVQMENSLGIAPLEERAATSDTALETADRNGRGAVSQRLQTYLPAVTVAVDVSKRAQTIETESTVRVSISTGRLDVEQQVQFTISHQPALEIAAKVPNDLLANEGLTLSLNGKPLTSADVEILSLPDGKTEAAAHQMRLAARLGRPTLGRVTLGIRSAVRLTERQAAGSDSIDASLATVPSGGSMTLIATSSLEDVAAALSRASVAAGWVVLDRPETAPSGAQAAALTAIANKPLSHVGLVLQRAAATEPEPVRVIASWAQTWLAGNMRQDRFVYRIEARGGHVALLTPGEFGNQPLEVLVNGRTTSIDVSQPGRIVVSLPTGEAAKPHTLELRRQSPQQVGSWGRLRTALPRVEGSDGGRPFFWQLIVPRELTAIGEPEGMSAEYLLGWQGMHWGRQPTQSQGDLERWTGAQQAPSPPGSMNQYLYSGFEPPSDVRVLLVRRLWVVIAAGLGALAVGLLWLHTNVGRAPAFWAAICVAAAGLLLSYPEAAVLLIQAAAVGVVFTIVSALTQWLLADARQAPAAPPPASSVASLAATQPWSADGGGSASRTAVAGLQSSGSPS
ncbi:MAG: hypothetical protein IT424_10985 [Pirellulales bacterium]|nr:hypothetical protein [Pirellulales bacterium]